MILFTKGRYQKAYNVFDAIKDKYVSALYQLGVILYDDLLEKVFKVYLTKRDSNKKY